MTCIIGKSILVLGGGGMVGAAVCQELAKYSPARIIVASRHEEKARRTVAELAAEHSSLSDIFIPVWGDVFLRAEWPSEIVSARDESLNDRERRTRVAADILAALDDEILHSSLLFQLINGTAEGLGGAQAEIVIDCMNTATALSYRDIYSLAHRLAELAESKKEDIDWADEIDALISALPVPQLVRHVQILYGAMREAGTQAYMKIGTSGTGGMGFNIPYTHGEEKPSRLLLSKAALAGAQTMLTFLMARTPDAPPFVREIKPAALIGWREISHGPVKKRGATIPLFDCPVAAAISIDNETALSPRGDFGIRTGENLAGVYVDTGENGIFTADEFEAITALGQMELITPEDVARSVVAELRGNSTGRDVVAALDSSISGPTYRGGYLRQIALSQLRHLEARHGKAVAFEILGPPRLSKLLYEAYLLKKVLERADRMAEMRPEAISQELFKRLDKDSDLRCRILSIGIPILLPDGRRLLRGPVIKSNNAHDGWVDLTPDNMRKWKSRLSLKLKEVDAELKDRTSSKAEHASFQRDVRDRVVDFPEPGEFVGWVFIREDEGQRVK